MLKFLKNLGRPPVADLVAYEDGILHFRCESQLTAGKRVNLHCRLPEGEEFGALMQVTGVLSESGLYTGYVDQPRDANQFLAMLLPVPFQERRRSPRIKKRVRLLSRDLRGYQSMTENLSQDGFCTLLEGALPVGLVMDVELDLDQGGLRPLGLQGAVRWCAPCQGGRHLVGCEFQSLTRGQSNTIRRFLESMGQLLPAE